MTRRSTVLAVIVMLAIALASIVGLAKQSDTTVIFDRNGNALIAYSGPKDHLPSFSASSRLQVGQDPLVVRTVSGTFELRAWKSTSYGDGSVRTEFISDVEYGTEGWVLYREVEGDSMTYWTGDIPQSLSDEIELAEYWKFGGFNVSVSFSGPGVSGSGDTIRFSGDDGGTGTHWYLVHIYSGYRAETIWWFTYTKQNSEGTHRFDSTLVSATAQDSESP